jgi:hypothetical protein
MSDMGKSGAIEILAVTDLLLFAVILIIPFRNAGELHVGRNLNVLVRTVQCLGPTHASKHGSMDDASKIRIGLTKRVYPVSD